MWCIKERSGIWHALPASHAMGRPEEDEAWWDPILCHPTDGIVAPGCREDRAPTCPDCKVACGLPLTAS